MTLPGAPREPADAACDASGFVLAGGQSSRMGRDKALLTFAGQPLIAHALAILREVLNFGWRSRGPIRK